MIPRLFGKGSFAATFKELQHWRDEGLISYQLSTTIDEIIAEVLRSVRERSVERIG